jgi:hypothetical protein
VGTRPKSAAQRHNYYAGFMPFSPDGNPFAIKDAALLYSEFANLPVFLFNKANERGCKWQS